MQYSFEQHKIIGGIGADDPYWAGLEDGRFLLPRCSGCQAWTWPAHYRCGKCGSWEFDWVELEPKGTVFTWTRSWYVFDRVRERADDVPYVTVVAEIPGADDARVMGVLQGTEEGLHTGAAVIGSIDPPSDKSKGYAAIRWILAGRD